MKSESQKLRRWLISKKKTADRLSAFAYAKAGNDDEKLQTAAAEAGRYVAFTEVLEYLGRKKEVKR